MYMWNFSTCLLLPLNNIMSVSYTHLDVYKRQVTDKANYWRNEQENNDNVNNK